MSLALALFRPQECGYARAFFALFGATEAEETGGMPEAFDDELDPIGDPDVIDEDDEVSFDEDEDDEDDFDEDWDDDDEDFDDVEDDEDDPDVDEFIDDLDGADGARAELDSVFPDEDDGY